MGTTTPRPPWVPLWLLVGAAALAGLRGAVEAYPAYLLDPQGCVEKKLEVGFELMGQPAASDRKRRSPIRVR